MSGIVNFTSDSILGMPTASTYTLTKGALFGVNKTLAIEGRPHNININCVSPIAHKPGIERHIQHFSEDAKGLFRTIYTPEGNVPIILALISDQCHVSGEVFNVAGCSVGRTVWGVARGESEMKTVEQCLSKLDDLCQKGQRQIYEPIGMADFVEFQAKYVLGK